MSIRIEEPQWEPTERQRAEAERNRLEQLSARLRVEEEARRREAERQEIERLRRGGETSRQRRASEYIAYVDGLTHGRWLPANETGASRGTVLDQGRALKVAEEAARAAVQAALEPLLAEAREELAAAGRERDARIRGCSTERGWRRCPPPTPPASSPRC